MQEIWAIRTRLRDKDRSRDLALFNLAVDSKLVACDLLKLRVSEILSSNAVNHRATVLQQKTGRPVRFEITRKTRLSVRDWIDQAGLIASDYLFPSRVRESRHLSLRQYSRIVTSWVEGAGLDASAYGTHSLRGPKQRCCIERPRISEQYNCCLAIRALIARFAIWESRSTMPWRCRSKLTRDCEWRPSGDGRFPAPQKVILTTLERAVFDEAVAGQLIIST